MHSEQQRNQEEFITAAKQHLQTIKQGLSNLAHAEPDPPTRERIYKAAKALKSAAAARGINSIERIAQVLETAFAVLKQLSVPFDRQLDELLKRVCSTLEGFVEMQAVIAQSQEPSYLTEGVEREVMAGTEPVLAQLQAHLDKLRATANPTSQAAPNSTTAALPPDFHKQVLLRLQEMVRLVKQENPSLYRTELLSYCQQLLDLARPAELPAWEELLATAQAAIAHPDNSVRATTSAAIKDIQNARELILAGRADEIRPSERLQTFSSRSVAATPPSWTTYTEEDEDGVTLGWEEEAQSALPGSEPDAEDSSSAVGKAELDRLADLCDHGTEEEDFWNDDGPPTMVEDERELTAENEDWSDWLSTGDPSESQVWTEAAETDQDHNSQPDEFLFLVDEDPVQATHSSESEFLSWSESLSLHEEQADEPLSDPSEQLDWWQEWETAQPSQSPPASDGPAELGLWDSTEDLESLFADEDTFIQDEEEAESLEEIEALASEASTASTPDVLAQQVGDEQPANPSACLDYYESFDALDFLLAETVSASQASQSNLLRADVEALAALLEQPASAATATPRPTPSVEAEKRVVDQSTVEFSDLESLLAQTDASMGLGSKVTSGGASTMRAPVKRGGFEQTLKVPVKQMDNLSNLMGELVVSRNSLEQDQERLRRFLDNLLEQVQNLNDLGGRMQDLYERSLLESSLLASKARYTTAGSSGVNPSARAMLEDYDPLEMDRFTAFHTLSQEMMEMIVRVRESSADIEFLVDGIDQGARTLRQVTTQLQEGLTKSRMVPFAQIADRLPRAVRDISLRLNKQAKLQIEGRETLVDKMILEQLYDPLNHLVNNAITHGIESPQVRAAAGKPPAGIITIRALHQGNQTLISISDDGAGIDPERIREKAIAKGLISRQEASTLSEVEIYDFIFHPGFTTKEQADDFAGRGVGMDVVRSSLSRLRGTINIDSTLGQGTTFTIGLPLTLSIGKALCCLNERSRIAFPMDGVEGMFDMTAAEIQTNEKGERFIPWKQSEDEEEDIDPGQRSSKSKTLLPFKPLSELLSFNRQLARGGVYGGQQEEDQLSVVVLRSAGNLVAVQVDRVLEEQEIVIKQLSGPVPKPPGIAGATVLSDGSVMAIADVIELIDLFYGRIRRDLVTSALLPGIQDPKQPEVVEKSEPLVLIVDDSITVRELLSMSFTKAGYRVEQARDGQEAWEKLRSGLPADLVFCDIEMPKMDGLELLSRLQKDEQLASIPVSMLTSRGAERHRKMAAKLGAKGYFTKPYLEEVLLDAAKRMIQGEVLLQREPENEESEL